MLIMDNGNEQQELSLTLKYLLENPALLQPPDSNSSEKCKEDCSFDQFQQSDLASAYLGPQIWSDTLLSDDLKLEPVDLDELLDTTGLEDEMGDLSSLMTSPPQVGQKESRPSASNDEASMMTYQDMPSLMSCRHSPSEKQMHSPSNYLQFPPPRHGVEHRTQQGLPQNETSRKQKLLEMQLYDQQYAILNDILGKNEFSSQLQPTSVEQPPKVLPPAPVKTLNMQTNKQQLPPHSTQSVHTNVGFVQQPPPSTVDSSVLTPNPQESAPTPDLKNIEIRIPSPKRVQYVPNTTDVIISTPQDVADPDSAFDPTKRVFTEEELKPQPIIRKSKKVHVPQDSKDGKYWNRRNKNNVAAKRSREARRIKENQIAMRANYLEQENATLKVEVTELRQELSRVVELLKKYESCS